MKDLIPVVISNINNSEVNSVSARELYLGLGLDKSQWKRWSDTNIIGNKFFKQTIDFIELDVVSSSPNPPKDYAVTIEFAKHLAMKADTDNAHDYRNYFIDCETRLKDKPSVVLPISYIAALEALIVSEKAKEAAMLELSVAKIELDVSHEWSSLKRFAAWNHVVWNSLSWKTVKDASFKVGKPPYKIFDANFPEGVNNYHIDAWKLAYPDYEFPEVLEH